MYDVKNLVKAIEQRERAIKDEREWMRQWETTIGSNVLPEENESFE